MIYSYINIIIAIILVSFGQILIKSQLIKIDVQHDQVMDMVNFIVFVFTNIKILLGLIAALFAAIFWMLALTKLPLNKAYPFLSLSFVTVTLLSSLVLGEHFSILKLAGVVIIVIGVTICGLAK
jgi:drug/metabolite transporter (DMT)-like permease